MYNFGPISAAQLASLWTDVWLPFGQNSNSHKMGILGKQTFGRREVLVLATCFDAGKHIAGIRDKRNALPVLSKTGYLHTWLRLRKFPLALFSPSS